MEREDRTQFALVACNRTNALATLLFHCFFNGDGSITHWMHDSDDELADRLPHLYVVYVSRKVGKQKRIVAGFFVKTDCMHQDFNFVEMLTAVASDNAGLGKLIDAESTFLPVPIEIPGKTRPTVEEMAQIMISQSIKCDVIGVVS
jgi:hypothetical protein